MDKKWCPETKNRTKTICSPQTAMSEGLVERRERQPRDCEKGLDICFYEVERHAPHKESSMKKDKCTTSPLKRCSQTSLPQSALQTCFTVCIIWGKSKFNALNNPNNPRLCVATLNQSLIDTDMHMICIWYPWFLLSNRVQIGVHVAGSFASDLLRTMESRGKHWNLLIWKSLWNHWNFGIYSYLICTDLYRSVQICTLPITSKASGKHRHCDNQVTSSRVSM